MGNQASGGLGFRIQSLGSRLLEQFPFLLDYVPSHVSGHVICDSLVSKICRFLAQYMVHVV